MTPTRARLLAAGRRRQYVLLALGEPDDDWTLLHDRVGRDPGRARPALTVRSLAERGNIVEAQWTSA